MLPLCILSTLSRKNGFDGVFMKLPILFFTGMLSVALRDLSSVESFSISKATSIQQDGLLLYLLLG